MIVSNMLANSLTSSQYAVDAGLKVPANFVSLFTAQTAVRYIIAESEARMRTTVMTTNNAIGYELFN